MTLFLRRVSLRTRFALTLAGLLFVVAALFGGLIGRHSVEQTRERIGQSLATDAQRVAERLDKEMADRSRDLGLIGAFDPMRNLQDPSAVQALLDGLRRSEPSYLWLAVTNLQGRVVAATDGSLLGNDISAISDLRDQLRGRPTSLGDPMRIVRPGDPDPPPAEVPSRQINISRPIRASDGSRRRRDRGATKLGLDAGQPAWAAQPRRGRGSAAPGCRGVIHRLCADRSAEPDRPPLGTARDQPRPRRHLRLELDRVARRRPLYHRRELRRRRGPVPRCRQHPHAVDRAGGGRRRQPPLPPHGNWACRSSPSVPP